MTARLRLYVAATACAIALPAGLITALPQAGPAISAARGGWAPQAAPGAADIDSFVARIAAAGLLPAAELRPPDGEETPGVNLNTVDELAALMANPDVAALFRDGGAWRLVITGAEGAAEVFVVGDRLEDGWEITDIGATHVALAKDGRSRRIDAFDTVEPED